MTGYGAQNLQYLIISAAILFGYHGNGGYEWKKFHTFFIPNDTCSNWIDKFAQIIKLNTLAVIMF